MYIVICFYQESYFLQCISVPAHIFAWYSQITILSSTAAHLEQIRGESFKKRSFGVIGKDCTKIVRSYSLLELIFIPAMLNKIFLNIHIKSFFSSFFSVLRMIQKVSFSFVSVIFFVRCDIKIYIFISGKNIRTY